MAGPLASYARLDALVEPKPEVKYPRTPGHRPPAADNPYNAWYYKCAISGSRSGKLKGRTVAIKDNVCVAGVPMMNGAAVLEGYVPDVDATVVTRILDAGGEIAGKAVCENLCFSGGSHTTALGPVLNPHNPAHSTGGSSSGCAALVACGAVDMAIGGDQGGSIRMPASWCGIYGLKPTHGLVPYTGAFPIEITLDHLGPMTRTVADCALLLEVIAGADGMDPRQAAAAKGERYTRALDSSSKLRIGVLAEGFGWPGASEADVDEAVRAAADVFAGLGWPVETVSIPLHRDGIHIWNGVAIEGATAFMVKGNGMGTNWKGWYNTSLLDVFARGPDRPNDLSETTKLVMLTGHMEDHYHARYYAKAQNPAARCRRLRRGGRAGRPAAHADDPDESHAHPARRLRARGVRRACARDAAEHRAFRRHRPSRPVRALREIERSADRHDAGRAALRRSHRAARGPCLRTERPIPGVRRR